MAVNLDRSESDLKPIAPEDIPAVMGLKNVTVSTSPDELLRQIQEHRVGRPLSEVTLWAVLILSALRALPGKPRLPQTRHPERLHDHQRLRPRPQQAAEFSNRR